MIGVRVIMELIRGFDGFRFLKDLRFMFLKNLRVIWVRVWWCG